MNFAILWLIKYDKAAFESAPEEILAVEEGFEADLMKNVANEKGKLKPKPKSKSKPKPKPKQQAFSYVPFTAEQKEKYISRVANELIGSYVGIIPSDYWMPILWLTDKGKLFSIQY
jgi:hypothetical protein